MTEALMGSVPAETTAITPEHPARKTYRALSSLVNRQRGRQRPVCEDHLHRLHILTAWHQSAFRRRRSLPDVLPAGRSCGWSPSSPRSSMATSMSMPILASAVARRPHLFVDVRASSRVHPVAGLAAINNFLAEKTRSNPSSGPQIQARARQCHRGKDRRISESRSRIVLENRLIWSQQEGLS